MTVKALKLLLATLPDNMEVFVAERKTTYNYGLVNSGYVREINFLEDPDGDPISHDVVFVLDEE